MNRYDLQNFCSSSIKASIRMFNSNPYLAVLAGDYDYADDFRGEYEAPPIRIQRTGSSSSRFEWHHSVGGASEGIIAA